MPFPIFVPDRFDEFWTFKDSGFMAATLPQTKGGVGEVRTELHRQVESLPSALSDLEPLHQHDVAQPADRLREGPVLVASEIVSRAERHIESDYARLRPGEPPQEFNVVATSPALGHVAQGAMSGWRFIHPQIRTRGCR